METVTLPKQGNGYVIRESEKSLTYPKIRFGVVATALKMRTNQQKEPVSRSERF
jgi:hypothetical protein